MRYPTHALIIGCTMAFASAASGANSEIWDKELVEGDFDAFDRVCEDDAQEISDMIERYGDYAAFGNREVAVVGRIKTQFFMDYCYEFVGICQYDTPSGQMVTPTVFFDERRLPLWHCVWPLADNRDWKVVKTEGTAFALGFNLRTE